MEQYMISGHEVELITKYQTAYENVDLFDATLQFLSEKRRKAKRYIFSFLV